MSILNQFSFKGKINFRFITFILLLIVVKPNFSFSLNTIDERDLKLVKEKAEVLINRYFENLRIVSDTSESFDDRSNLANRVINDDFVKKTSWVYNDFNKESDTLMSIETFLNEMVNNKYSISRDVVGKVKIEITEIDKGGYIIIGTVTYKLIGRFYNSELKPKNVTTYFYLPFEVDANGLINYNKKIKILNIALAKPQAFVPIEIAQQQVYIDVRTDGYNKGVVNGGGVYKKGEFVTLNAKPNSDHLFTGWEQNGTLLSKNSIYTFKATEETSYTATFKSKYNTLNLSPSSYEGGQVFGGGKYLTGTSVSISATPSAGWYFLGWKQGYNIISSENRFNINVNENISLEGVFKRKSYNVEINIKPKKAGNVYGSGQFDYDSRVNLTTSSNRNWAFSKWILNGKVVSNNAYYSFNLKNNRKITAKFKRHYFSTSLIYTRINFNLSYNYLKRPFLLDNSFSQTKYLDIDNHGVELNFGWKVIESSHFDFGLFFGGMYGANSINKAVRLFYNTGEEEYFLKNSQIYSSVFGVEIAAGWPKVKFLLRYKNDIESQHINFQFESSSFDKAFNSYKYELRRETYQFGVLVVMKDGVNRYSKLNQNMTMDVHLNIGNEFVWNWNKPNWEYKYTNNEMPDFGLGLKFSFPWVSFGSDFNFNVQSSAKRAVKNPDNFYLNAKIGFNLAPRYKY